MARGPEFGFRPHSNTREDSNFLLGYGAEEELQQGGDKGSPKSGTMPRKPRIEYPGAINHVMSRGDQREGLFPGEVDRYDCVKAEA